MTTYYWRSETNGEIINATESSLPLHVLRERYPLAGAFYDPDPPLAVLQRYRYWDERP